MHASLHVCACSRLDGVNLWSNHGIEVDLQRRHEPAWNAEPCWTAEFWPGLPILDKPLPQSSSSSGAFFHSTVACVVAAVVFANQQSIHDQNPSSVKSKRPQNTFANVEFMATTATMATELRFGSIWHGLDRLLPGWLVCFFVHNAVEHDVIFLAMYDVQRNKVIKRNQKDTNWTLKNQQHAARSSLTLSYLRSSHNCHSFWHKHFFGMGPAALSSQIPCLQRPARRWSVPSTPSTFEFGNEWTAGPSRISWISNTPCWNFESHFPKNNTWLHLADELRLSFSVHTWYGKDWVQLPSHLRRILVIFFGFTSQDYMSQFWSTFKPQATFLHSPLGWEPSILENFSRPSPSEASICSAVVYSSYLLGHFRDFEHIIVTGRSSRSFFHWSSSTLGLVLSYSIQWSDDEWFTPATLCARTMTARLLNSIWDSDGYPRFVDLHANKGIFVSIHRNKASLRLLHHRTRNGDQGTSGGPTGCGSLCGGSSRDK